VNITSGLFDHMVLQRSARNVSDADIAGETSAGGKVQARVRAGSKTVRGFDWKSIGSARDGKFSAKLQGIPVGGPYTIELRVGDSSKEKLTVRDVLVGDVWLLGGQSNMQGCGRHVDREKPHPKVRGFFMDDRWRVAEDPIHNMWDCVDRVHLDLQGVKEMPKPKKILGGVGPGVAFGVEMHRLTKIPQGVIACAHGGTSMAQWDPKLCATQESCLYGAMIRRLKKNGNKVAGLVWYQGESDANDQVFAKYTDAMKEMIAELRNEARDPKLPVAIVQLSRVMGWGQRVEWNSIQEQQRRLPEQVKNATVVPAVDLELDDSIHIGGKANHRLGVRLAQAMAALRKVPKAGKPPIAFKSAKIDRDPVSGLAILRVKFDNVVGSLRAGGRAQGFSVRGPDESFLFRIDVRGDEALLWMCDPAFKLTRKYLHYGQGTDPFCNITDEADRSLPVFGPVPIGNGELRTEFVRSIEVSDLQPSAGKLESLAHPDGTLQYRTREFTGDFCDLHQDLTSAGDRVVFFRCAIDCPEPMKLAARLGYDGPVKTWVDGREVFHDPKGANPAFPDKGVAKFDATPGRHEVVVALGTNNGLAWGICLQFQRLDIPRKAIEKTPDAFALPKIGNGTV
jgi:sialate O-acetylesterase